ncbi:MAG: metallophosphoesterase family protein [Promethearchaeota archaeon]
MVQFSDLHYGHKEFRPQYFDRLVDYIVGARPDVAVCTGDITDSGNREQFADIKPYLDLIRDIVPLVCVPGNHDAKNNGLLFYEEFIGPRTTKLEFPEEKLLLLGLSSPLTDVRSGYLGNFQLQWMVKMLQRYPEHKTVLALHHHLVQVPDAGRNRDTIWDAGDVLEVTQTFDVDLVLMGHRHVPHAYTIGNTTLLYCCTSATVKTKAEEHPSCNHIVLEDDRLEVHTISSVDGERKPLYKREGGRVVFSRRRNTRLRNLLEFPPYRTAR